MGDLFGLSHLGSRGIHIEYAGAGWLSPGAGVSALHETRQGFQDPLAGRLAVLIYGFEDHQRPLSWLIEAFEAVAARTVSLGSREVAPLANLVHPVFTAGKVYAWEVLM
jgi:hypothetical protein